MRYLSLLILFTLISCGEKNVLLPKSNVTIVEKVEDLSPVYFFFKMEGKDTLVEINKKNMIGTTNWIFNIDKRLPLRLVIPEIMKLQTKRENGMHDNPLAQNYYSYADSIGKNLAFLPFTKVKYTMLKPKSSIVFVAKNGQFKIDNRFVNESELREYLKNNSNVVFGFDKNMNYGSYIQFKILITDLKNKSEILQFSDIEYCF
ncbi:MAG: hypothetical protein ACI7YS_03290 [Flavobacterium sp.]